MAFFANDSNNNKPCEIGRARARVQSHMVIIITIIFRKKKTRNMTQGERDARLERIKGVLQERGEDVAKLVKTWLHKEE